MPYVIKTKDKAGHAHVRAEVLAEHRKYLESNKERILAAGGLLPDASDTPNGGLLILDVNDRPSAEAFIANDPFTKAGLFEEISIQRWRKVYFDYAYCL
jgi:uncharacterized protein YciI